jgi:hypothetical protein
VTGHTKWSELRDRVYEERPGMAERVATLRASERTNLDEGERWQIELEAEAVGDPPSEESLKEQLVTAVGDAARVLNADVEIRAENGHALLLVVLVIAFGVGAAVAAERFADAGKTAEVLRLQLEDYGPVVGQSIRRAA